MLSWLNVLIGIAAVFAAFALVVTSGTQLVRQVARLKARFLVERLRRLFGELLHRDRFVAAILTHPSLEGSRGRTFFAALVDPDRKQGDPDVRRAIETVLGSGDSPGLWNHPWPRTQDLDRQSLEDIATAVWARIGPEVDARSGGAALGSADAVKAHVAAFHDEAKASVSDSFTTVVRLVTVGIAAVVAFLFGLDAIDITTRISRTDPARIDAFAQAVQRLEPVAAAGGSSNGTDGREVADVRATLTALEQGPICLCFMGRPLTPPLPGGAAVGKAVPPCPTPSPQGFLLSVLALSLGAPFWFEFLKWGINMKSSFTKESP